MNRFSKLGKLYFMLLAKLNPVKYAREVGGPARVIKSSDEYFEKLQKESLHLGHLSWKERDDALRALLSEEP